eukprot:CAMPEP_0201520756 /NCGR_PEP_ID=MMETSP0161_2-20130828/12486_1 /ASSEMBLY_ACC=CAM_ASM_000251 /TAXON_ID=180227 /ORGANISM="Neoparamoeba aestuarina, Strain SoJaBio B1-5/56/2" /LENGTH=166 /DNA_ID=CAMNT_0047919235 /DNA_START=52 /DNA_END=552 /DNA_ORIENTATION=+
MGLGGSREEDEQQQQPSAEVGIQVDANLLQAVWERKQQNDPPPSLISGEDLAASRAVEREGFSRQLKELHQQQDDYDAAGQMNLKNVVRNGQKDIYEKLDTVWEADNSLLQYSHEMDRNLEKGRRSFHSDICLSEREDILDCLQGGNNIRDCSAKIQAFDQCSRRV